MSLVILVATLLGMIFEEQIGISLSVAGCIGAILLILIATVVSMIILPIAFPFFS